MSAPSESVLSSQQSTNGVPQLSRKFVARRISEGETGRLKEELKCQACGKGYKHVSSLAKHLWEHTPEWNVTSKLLISKHQQVQLLEAASILVSMNEEDEEKDYTQNGFLKEEGKDDSEELTSDDAPSPGTTIASDSPRSKLSPRDKSSTPEASVTAARPIQKPKNRRVSFTSGSPAVSSLLSAPDSWIKEDSLPPTATRRRRSTLGRILDEERDGLVDPKESSLGVFGEME